MTAAKRTRTGPAEGEQLAQWMVPLSPEVREAVRRNAAQAPPLTARQRAKLQLLFNSRLGGAA
ncbi:hypothetical protein ABGB19_03280 [Mycobacterium sp. B14F4]|uniref:hypothetical protein n=1 Tax=Mycobacterium sp. B14F4 TaxID=3153565 RepID=UPI00325EDD9C